MDSQRLWLQLTELAGSLGVEVRMELLEDSEGYKAQGGLCRLGDRLVAFVDRRQPLRERCLQLGVALAASKNLDEVYLRPAVREFLEMIADS